jgi:hypothetical protein
LAPLLGAALPCSSWRSSSSAAAATAALAGPLQQLLSGKLGGTTALLLALWFATALGYSGVVILTTELILTEAGGGSHCEAGVVQVPA